MDCELFQGCMTYRNIDGDLKVNNNILIFDEFTPRTSLLHGPIMNGGGITFSTCENIKCVICDTVDDIRNLDLSKFNNISEVIKYINSL